MVLLSVCSEMTLLQYTVIDDNVTEDTEVFIASFRGLGPRITPVTYTLIIVDDDDSECIVYNTLCATCRSMIRAASCSYYIAIYILGHLAIHFWHSSVISVLEWVHCTFFICVIFLYSTSNHHLLLHPLPQPTTLPLPHRCLLFHSPFNFIHFSDPLSHYSSNTSRHCRHHQWRCSDSHPN